MSNLTKSEISALSSGSNWRDARSQAWHLFDLRIGRSTFNMLTFADVQHFVSNHGLSKQVIGVKHSGSNQDFKEFLGERLADAKLDESGLKVLLSK